MEDERKPIDPQDRYPACGLRRAEEHALRVLSSLPTPGEIERTRDAIQIDSGGDEGIVILVTAEAIEFRLPTVEWTGGAFGAAATSRLWRRVKADSLPQERLDSLIRQAFEARRREFVRCKYCHELVPVEHRDGKVCHGCAEQHEGVVH